MGLEEKLTQMKKDFEKKAPKETVEKMHRATAELKQSALAEKALGAGDRAPDFALPDTNGNSVRLQDALAGGPLVLTFYRGLW